MSAVGANVARIAAAHREVGADAPPWLRELRAGAMTHFERVGFPTTRVEDWKYTNLRSIERRAFAPASQAPTPPASLPETPFAGAAETLVFLNGWLHEHRDEAQARPLAAALADGSIEGRLGELVELDHFPIAALNTAFATDGAVVDFGVNGADRQPVYLKFVSLPDEQPALIPTRVLIDVPANRRGVIIEHHCGVGDAANFTTAVTEIRLGRGAQLDYYRLQTESSAGFHIGSVHVVQEADSTLRAHGIDLGGRLVRNDFHARLVAPGARVELDGLYVVNGTQHVDNHTRIDHSAAHTSCREQYRGVLSGRSRAVFNGKIVVDPGAQKTDAHLSNDNLLLSGKSEIDTKPELEIYADDVKCSHGVTVGQLDENKLFYLRSRGIDAETARALLTFAFADEVLCSFDLPGMREHIEHLVIARLPEERRVEDLL